jgi:DNA-binding transcriptional LysR family regulator
MHLRTIHYFVAIADAGSFTAAAAAIPLAQPALTRQMHDLEKEMGVQLLQRMPRGVLLTPAGVTFYESAQRILNEASRLRQRLSHQKDTQHAQVVLGVSPTLARVLLPGLLENCFNHNIVSKNKPLHIKISSSSNFVKVENNHQQKSKTQSTGYGLKNIAGRYRFASNNEIEIIENENIFAVSLPLI